MRFERWLLPGAVMVLSGCVTTHTNTGSLAKALPAPSKSEQAESAARIHTELAQHYMNDGDLQTALAKLQMALKFDPDYAPAHTVIAVVYEKINNLPEAEKNYREAVALEPSKGAPNNNLGVFLCHVGKEAEAIGFFQRAVADPFYQTPDVALTNEGVCQLRRGDVPGAETAFRDALAHNPKSGEALYQLANTLYLHNDAFHASAFLQRLDALGNPTAATLKLGHDIEIRLGDPEGALTYSKRLQRQFPDSEQARALATSAGP